MSNKKTTRFTPSEDTMIREAIASGVTLKNLSVALGKSESSISGRKYYLKLEGRFGSGKSAPANVSKSNEQVKEAEKITLFILEDDVPMPSRTRNEEERNKIREILKVMRVNQSFALPRNLSHVAVHLIKTEFPEYKIKCSATSKEKKFYRIYRLA